MRFIHSVAWYFRRRRLLGDLDGKVDSLQDRLQNIAPFCAYVKVERANIRKQLSRIRIDLRQDLRMARLPPFEILKGALARVESQSIRVDQLAAQNDQWRILSSALAGETQKLIEGAAVFPGRQFAKDLDQREREIKRILKTGGTLDRPAKVKHYLANAEKLVANLRRQVHEADEVVKGLPDLSEAIAALDPKQIAQDIALEQGFKRLVLTRDQIQADLRSGHYPAGYRLLGGAKRLCAQVQSDLAKRRNLVRQEIDLWLGEPEIVRRFELFAFPPHLSAEDIQRWHEIRIEIGRIVEARIAATRAEYARGCSPRSNMRFSANQLRDWDTLAAFARSAVQNSKYP